jgi:membrane protein
MADTSQRQDGSAGQGSGSDDIEVRDDDPAEVARGRQADAPQQIPAKGWKDVAVRVKQEARQDNVTLVAAGIAFYGLLALAPALAATVSIYGLVATPEEIPRQMDRLFTAMPAEAKQLITEQLNQVVSTSGTAKGIGVVLGIAVALWSASAATKNLIVALSAMYDEDEDRGFLKLRLRALALTVGAIAFLLVTVLLLAVAPGWLGDVGGSAMSTVVAVLRWPVLIVLMMAALAVLYRVAPNRDEPRWRWTSWGAALATVVWIVASLGFSFYSSNFGNYSKTYGSMAVVVVTMLWLWITALCVLLGAEVNAELERQTAKDSTKGAERPRGQRDAVAADTVGAPAGR